MYRITDNGFVGIGTSSPAYALSVEGSSSLGNQAIAGYFTATTTANNIFPNLISTNATTTNSTTTGALALTYTTPARLLSVAINGVATSTDLSNWLTGTTNQITMTDSGTGGLIASLPSLLALTNASTTQFTVSNSLWAPGNTLLGNATSTNFFATTASSTNLFATSGSIASLITASANLGSLSGASVSSLTANYLPKWNNGTFVNSLLSDNGTNVSSSASIIPTANKQYNLGSPADYWSNAYIDNVTANNFSAASTSIAGTNSSSFSIDSNNPTNDTQDISLVFYRGVGAPSNGVLSWNSTQKRFEFNQNLFTSGSLSANSLSLTNALPVTSGGTGQTTLTAGQLLYGSGTGAVQSVATTTVTTSGALSFSSNPVVIGGSSPSLSLSNNSTLSTAGNTLGINLANPNTWTGTQTFSTLPILGSLSGLIAASSGAPYQVATSSASCSSGVSCSSFTVVGAVSPSITNTGLLSLQQLGGGTAQTGAITFATSSAATSNGVTVGENITNSAGAFTFTPTVSVSNIPNSALANSTISGISLGSNLATLTFGTYLTGTSYNGSTPVTIATNATSANTASTLVARDASGNFSAGALTLATALSVPNGGTGQSTLASGQLLYGSGTGAIQTIGTTTPTLGLGLNYSGTLGSFVGGGSGTVHYRHFNALFRHDRSVPVLLRNKHNFWNIKHL